MTEPVPWLKQEENKTSLTLTNNEYSGELQEEKPKEVKKYRTS